MNLNFEHDTIDHSISLGIVIFNTSFIDLEECFASIQLSTILPKVIILCNSENQEYQSQVENLCLKYKYEYIKSANEGFGAGHNKIISRVITDWYICCNPDINLDKNALKLLLEESKQLEQPVQITPQILNRDGTVQKLCKKHLSLFSWIHRQLWRIFPQFFKPYEEKFDYNKTQKIEFVTGCFFLIKTEIYLKIGGFSTEFFLYCEDADFSRRASKFGSNYYVASASVTHKWGKAYVRSIKYFKIELYSLFTYFKKHGVF